ncbi:unnamed protein product, partial [Allacma fusca]
MAVGHSRPRQIALIVAYHTQAVGYHIAPSTVTGRLRPWVTDRHR